MSLYFTADLKLRENVIPGENRYIYLECVGIILKNYSSMNFQDSEIELSYKDHKWLEFSDWKENPYRFEN